MCPRPATPAAHADKQLRSELQPRRAAQPHAPCQAPSSPMLRLAGPAARLRRALHAQILGSGAIPGRQRTSSRVRRLADAWLGPAARGRGPQGAPDPQLQSDPSTKDGVPGGRRGRRGSHRASRAWPAGRRASKTWPAGRARGMRWWGRPLCRAQRLAVAACILPRPNIAVGRACLVSARGVEGAVALPEPGQQAVREAFAGGAQRRGGLGRRRRRGRLHHRRRRFPAGKAVRTPTCRAQCCDTHERAQQRVHSVCCRPVGGGPGGCVDGRGGKDAPRWRGRLGRRA